MPWQTKRAIKADLVTARRCIVQMHNKAADLAEAHDLEIRQLGRQVADRDERIALLVIEIAKSWKDADRAKAYADRHRLAWQSARRRAAREHDEVRLWQRLTTYAEEARDEAKGIAWRYRLAWMSAKERASELRRHHDLVAGEFDDHIPAVEITGSVP